MNRSTDTLSGSPSFTVATRKVLGEQGAVAYEASCPSLPEDIAPLTRQEESDAIRDLRMVIERWVMSGGRSGGTR